MTEYKSEFTFQLMTPVKFHSGGNVAESSELTLKAPSNKQRNESAKLKQGFFRALKGMADNRGDIDAGAESKEKGDAVITGDEVMSIIMMSDIDLSDYQDSFRKLLVNGTCFVEEVKLTDPMYNSLSDYDTEKLMGEYVANFLLASHLAKMATK